MKNGYFIIFGENANFFAKKPFFAVFSVDFSGKWAYNNNCKRGTDNGKRAGRDLQAGNREGKTHHKPARTLTTKQQPGEGFGG